MNAKKGSPVIETVIGVIIAIIMGAAVYWGINSFIESLPPLTFEAFY
jgi:hypothetical protein